MNVPLLVLITGPPCGGKTTLAGRLAVDLPLPLFAKDYFKEALADSLGIGDREWSRKLGIAATALLYATADVELSAARSLILESNFDPQFAEPAIRRLQAQHSFSIIQIHCSASATVIYERYLQRAATELRHAIHFDRETFQDHSAQLLIDRHPPLEIEGGLITVDTNRFDEARYAVLRDRLRSENVRHSDGEFGKCPVADNGLVRAKR